MEGTTPSQYFKTSLETSLMEVLVDCAKKKPDNPLIFIASCLETKFHQEGKDNSGHLKNIMNNDQEKSQENTQLSSLFLKKSFDLPIQTYQLKGTTSHLAR